MSAKKLTGNKRVLQDHVVDLYNSVQKWKLLTSDCHSTVKSICLVKQKSLHDQDQNVSKEALSEDFSKLENLSSELLQKLKKLEVVAEKIREIPGKLQSLQKLSYREQSTDENSHSELSIIGESSEEIGQMYTKEFKMKLSIAKEICSLRKESQLIFFEAYWKYEPNIDRELVDSYLKRMIFALELHSELS